MMKLKEYMLKDAKERVYDFYSLVVKQPLAYEKVSRNDMYHSILSLYKSDPEIITQLCNVEEINILKKLLDDKIKKQENGYIDYLLFQDLQKHYLVLLENNEYSIPEDLVNYVKMAFNLLDEEQKAMSDVIDSVILGIAQVYNTIKVDEVILLLSEHTISYDRATFMKQIKSNLRWKRKVEVVRYKKEDYLVSCEFPYYKDVLKLRRPFKMAKYRLEELISFGKYKLDLFQEKVLNFLNFLEMHLYPVDLNAFLNDLIFYAGFDVHSESILTNICGSIEELYKETSTVLPEFPVWIYNGNNLHHLKENIILPDRNEPCICGSGKKFKSCCEKLFK